MKVMCEEKIKAFIKEWTWGTIIAVNDDKPCAIEISFGSDKRHIYCGSRPGGIMLKCIKANPNVIFKICDADKHYPSWKALSVFGKIERLTKKEDILYGMKTIAKRVIYTAKKLHVMRKILKKQVKMQRSC